MNKLKYKNTETGKVFVITKGENQIDARQDGGPDKGHIDYQINGNKMALKNMFSDPEKGSGLGSLLLFLAVKDAIEQKCELVEILNATLDNNREFYFKMGCRTDTSVLSGLSEEEKKKLAGKCPLGGEAMTVFSASHASMFKRWEPQ
jgi:hypothetical protein